MKALKDVLPIEAYEYETVQKYFNVEVLREVDSFDEPWVGKHKNVMNWFILANGKAIGWNENPAIGWSFPVITYKE